MKQATTTTLKETRKSTPLSGKEKEQRKQQVLAQGRSSITRSIADAVVIKNANLFFLTRPDGSVPLEDSHGYGLYYHDCRFLNGSELTLANAHLNSLVSSITAGNSAIFEFTNPELMVREGEHIPSEQIGVTLERTLDGENLTLTERILLKNYGSERAKFPLSLRFQAGFEDVFAIRGLLSGRPGKVYPPDWKDGVLTFVYQGADKCYRGLAIHFLTHPSSREQAGGHYDVTLEPRESKEFRVVLRVIEESEQSQLRFDLPKQNGESKAAASNVRPGHGWFHWETEYQSDSLLLNRLINNSLRDLQMLITSIDDSKFFAAGIPWFATLFGRDSLITGLETLAFQPQIAKETLRLLAKFQAQEADPWRDAQPGKILHEIRIGELARLGEIPHTPYYGTVDATPLFLILLARHAAWTGQLSLFEELREAAESALTWIDQYGDSNGDGYVEYESKSQKGLINQGWKDSGNAIVHADGSLATPPISLVEVQGYVYEAKMGMATLFERAGDQERGKQLRREAQALRSKFNQDFWLEDQGIYALALESNGEPLRIVSSNPGHTLWSGIADPQKAKQTAERLMSNDMFNGWGIRTLSSNDHSYNPNGYHLGTVWPHDNALIAVGFRRYGFDQYALRILKGILEAAMNFRDYRLPELFAGFSRAEYKIPVSYPVACHPQAWAAGCVPYLVSSFLGLEPNAFDNELRIHKPMLPDFVDRMQVRRLPVGEARVDLNYERTSDGITKVEVENLEGKLNVIKP